MTNIKRKMIFVYIFKYVNQELSAVHRTVSHYYG